MYDISRREPDTPVYISVIRIILALVFIVSGFLKGVDPWGSAIQFGEYFRAFHMEWLDGGKYFFAIAQAALEMWLGLLLLFNQLKRFSRILVMLFMIFFTLLTLVIALTNPVSDCGCFGEAIKLTHWETFIKNVILLPLSILLFLHLRQESGVQHPRRGAILISLLLSVLPGMWAIHALPWIDFLPYKVGTNIAQKMYIAPEDRGEFRTTVIYRNLETGSEEEFELSDTTWYNAEVWEFVDTREEVIAEGIEPEITNFVLFNPIEDATEEILNEEEVFILIADRLEEVSAKEAARIGQTARFAEERGIRAICLTTSSLSEGGTEGAEAAFGRFLRDTGLPASACYNIDATTLKTMLRAHQGLIILKKGTIIAKMNLKQVPDFQKKNFASGTEYVLTTHRQRGEMEIIIIYIILIGGLLFGRCNRCKG